MSIRSKYWSEDSYLDKYDALLPVLHKVSKLTYLVLISKTSKKGRLFPPLCRLKTIFCTLPSHTSSPSLQKTYRLQMQGNELGDYSPHPYAEEGDPETSSQLDAISIPESPFNTDMLLHLGPRFNTLASLCTTKLNSS